MPTRTITLCGSTRFKDEYAAAAKKYGELGWLVISITTFTHADNIETSEETSAILDAVHMRKIMMSDAIGVINKGGYIGYSTLREIAFAASLGKDIKFIEYPHDNIIDMIQTAANGNRITIDAASFGL